MLHRETLPDGRTRLTFVLPAHEPPGEVSVVGSFNHWRAGEHPLQIEDDGTRRVSVTVDEGNHHFRYLATGNVWADDPDADSINEHGSTVHCPAAAALAASSAPVGADSSAGSAGAGGSAETSGPAGTGTKTKTSRARNGASKSTSTGKAPTTGAATSSSAAPTKKSSRAATSKG